MVLLALAQLALASAARGQACQSPLALPGLAGEMPESSVGQWAEYGALNVKGMDRPTFRVALVEASWEGRPRRWIEFWFDRNGSTALRALLGEKDKAVVFLKQGYVIFTVPESPLEAAKACRGGVTGTVQEVELSTPAGVFKTRKMRRSSGRGPVDLWQTSDLPPLTLARIEFTGGVGWEVIGRGGEARSAFPEKFKAVAFPKPDALNALLPADFRSRMEKDKEKAASPDASVAPPTPSEKK
jgi:hypothetical protein